MLSSRRAGTWKRASPLSNSPRRCRSFSPGGGSPLSRLRRRHQTPGDPDDLLRCRVGDLGSRSPEDQLARQAAHGDSGGPGQGTQRPLCHALAQTARYTTQLLAGSAAAGMALPGYFARPITTHAVEHACRRKTMALAADEFVYTPLRAARSARAFNASAIMDSWPTATASRSWRGVVNFLPCRSPRRRMRPPFCIIVTNIGSSLMLV
jgi:hypothetical protein